MPCNVSILNLRRLIESDSHPQALLFATMDSQFPPLLQNNTQEMASQRVDLDMELLRFEWMAMMSLPSELQCNMRRNIAKRPLPPFL